LGQRTGAAGCNVQDDAHGGGQIGRKAAHHASEGLDASSRSAHHHQVMSMLCGCPHGTSTSVETARTLRRSSAGCVLRCGAGYPSGSRPPFLFNVQELWASIVCQAGPTIPSEDHHLTACLTLAFS
jgi:hypothetical protein